MSNNEDILKGPGFKAQLKFYDCKSSDECITACPENAITRGRTVCRRTCVTALKCCPGNRRLIR